MTRRLIVIAGPARSGTTALLRLIMAHPDVRYAGPDELGTRRSSAKTYESGVFVLGRDQSDDEIREKFRPLLEGEGFVVEKTPDNVFFIDRIKRVFPDAILVCTLRHGLDVVHSVGEAKKTFWMSGAPADFRAACLRWRRAILASHDAILRHGAVEARYETVFADFRKETRKLFARIGLSLDAHERCVASALDVAAIGIDGVYRKGEIGEGRRTLSLLERLVFWRLCGRAALRTGYGPFGR